METLTPQTENHLSRTGETTMDEARKLIEFQEYLILRQNEVMAAGIKRNITLVTKANELARENHALRKELEGHKSGKLWTVIASMLPTIEVKLQ